MLRETVANHERVLRPHASASLKSRTPHAAITACAASAFAQNTVDCRWQMVAAGTLFTLWRDTKEL